MFLQDKKRRRVSGQRHPGATPRAKDMSGRPATSLQTPRSTNQCGSPAPSPSPPAPPKPKVKHQCERPAPSPLNAKSKAKNLSGRPAAGPKPREKRIPGRPASQGHNFPTQRRLFANQNSQAPLQSKRAVPTLTGLREWPPAARAASPRKRGRRARHRGTREHEVLPERGGTDGHDSGD